MLRHPVVAFFASLVVIAIAIGASKKRASAEDSAELPLGPFGVKASPEPPRNPAPTIPGPFGAPIPAPNCKTVSADANANIGNQYFPSTKVDESGADYFRRGCASFVADYTVHLPTAPIHADIFTVEAEGQPRPATERACRAWEMEARFYWKRPIPQAQWQFLFRASVGGRWNGQCTLYAKDENTRHLHSPWRPSTFDYVIRVAVDGRIGTSPVKVGSWIGRTPHTHAPLPL